jgi:protoporphyrinogen oxidase
LGAYLLAKRGRQVIMLEQSNFLGGVLHSDEWEGIYLDKGCHLFSNEKNEATKVMFEIMDGDILPVQVSYASIIGEKKSNGCSGPDILGFGIETQKQVLFETIQAATEDISDPLSFFDTLKGQYGLTAARLLSGAVQKNYGLPAKKLDAALFPISDFRRLRIVSDKMASLLKENSKLDNRIVASGRGDYFTQREEGSIDWPHQNYYPANRGMRGFCEAAKLALENMGVKIKLNTSVENIKSYNKNISLILSGGTEIKAENLLWTIDTDPLAKIIIGKAPIESYINNVPIILYYFLVNPKNISHYTYITDFRNKTQLFRASTPGVYGHQYTSNGFTYVCFEETTQMGSANWKDPEKNIKTVWREGVDMGIVSGELPSKSKILKSPVSYKGLKPGYLKEHQKLVKRIQDFSNRIILPDQTIFGKNEIFNDLQETLLYTN